MNQNQGNHNQEATCSQHPGGKIKRSLRDPKAQEEQGWQETGGANNAPDKGTVVVPQPDTDSRILCIEHCDSTPYRREPPFIKPKQFEKLLKRLREPYRTMVLLAMMTSMRIGEILALRWGRVNLQNGTIRVSETFYRGQFSTVRSQRSNRQIPLSPLVLTALRNLKRRGKAGEEDLVFATRNRTPLSDGNVLKRVIYPACEKLKMPRLGWHAMRHLHSTLLSQLGVPVAVAQAQLGHADPRTTLSI